MCDGLESQAEQTGEEGYTILHTNREETEVPHYYMAHMLKYHTFQGVQ